MEFGKSESADSMGMHLEPGSPKSMADPEEPTDYWRHIRRGFDPGTEDRTVNSMRAPSQLIGIYLVYFLPILVLGVAGWTTYHYHLCSPTGTN
jgi:hypothetical protein